ncbi:MAG: hypothetical protein J7454_16800 [Roseiflexus sp.]|nr:hypothetical protein [Roseiflexus sp.]
MPLSVEKGRLAQDRVDELFQHLAVPNGSYAVAPLDLAVARALWSVPHTLIPEMPDRIITATALALSLPLITRDATIQRSSLVQTVWE